MDSLRAKAERLRAIARGDEQYGTGSRDEQATRFVLDEILADATAKARRTSPVRRKVDLLISLAGFTPLTTITAYEILRPEHLLVVFSEQAKVSVDVIGDYVIGKGGLSHSQFDHRAVDPTDPQAVYKVIKGRLAELDAAHPYAVLDITGGKKVMSAAASLAAWQLDLELCYIDGDYDPETRRVIPGTERLLRLANPTTIFGDVEMDRVAEIFRSGAFEAARHQYHELCERIAEPGRARFMRALSDVYRAWCDLDLSALPDCITAVEQAQRALDRRHLSADTAKRLRVQFDFLHRLAQPTADPAALLMCFFVLGLHYEHIGRRDFAALLFYRTIEGCFARRLELKYSGFDCESPQYDLLGVDTLEQRYLGLDLGGRPERSLPASVGLMAAAKLLFICDDEFIKSSKLDTLRALASLRDLTWTRNRSVLAHGHRPIAAADTALLRNRARDLLSRFWRLHGTGEDFRQLCDQLRFIDSDR